MDLTRGTSFADHRTIYHRGFNEFDLEFYTDTGIRLILELEPARVTTA